MSDLHFGAEDKAALAWFAREAQAQRPDAIIVTGDLTMRARRREFRAAQDWLETLPAPLSIEVGNHDLPFFNLFARFADPYGRFERLERDIERRLDLPGLDIIPLRTTARVQWRLDWSKGHMTPARVEQAKGSLVRAHGPIRLIACHHPLIEPETRGTARTHGGREALEALALAGADGILSGHVHDPYDRTIEIEGQPVRLIGAGTLSERVRDSRPSYNAIRTEGEALAVEIRYAA
ncbi:metallophosphoesterase family protein [Sphingobium nicotianae]|uniref:metallophosphoesterase family protein n=1 Tax=Sphingobium nicotianae TaxID=2782607 RepID=UPI0032D94846